MIRKTEFKQAFNTKYGGLFDVMRENENTATLLDGMNFTQISRLQEELMAKYKESKSKK